jgi:hypothetical protein
MGVRKKALFVGFAWIIVVVIPTFMLYVLRENPSVKEFIEWALKDWPILVALGGIAIIISGIILKYDFSSKKRQTIAQVPKKEPLSIEQARETKSNNIHIIIEGHVPISSEIKRDIKRAQDAKKKLEKSMEESLRNYFEKDNKKKV